MKRLRRAALVTFLVYVTLTLLGLVPTLPLAGSLGAIEAPETPGGGALLDVIDETAPALGAGTTAGLVLAFVLWLLSPLLQMAWLGALASHRTAGEALSFGASRYARAVVVSLWMTIPLAAVVLALVVPPAVGHLALASSPNERVHDLVVLALLVPGAFLLLVWCAWHDMARAALASGHDRPRDAVRASLGRLGAPAVLSYAGWTGLAALLAVGGHALGAWLDGSGGFEALLALVLLQVLALSRVACRGAWLGAALDRVEP